MWQFSHGWRRNWSQQKWDSTEGYGEFHGRSAQALNKMSIKNAYTQNQQCVCLCLYESMNTESQISQLRTRSINQQCLIIKL